MHCRFRLRVHDGARLGSCLSVRPDSMDVVAVGSAHPCDRSVRRGDRANGHCTEHGHCRRVLPRGLQPLFRHRISRRNRAARRGWLRWRLVAHGPRGAGVAATAGVNGRDLPLLRRDVHAAQLALLHAVRVRVRHAQAGRDVDVRGCRLSPQAPRWFRQLPGGHERPLPPVQREPERCTQSPLHDEPGRVRADARCRLDSGRPWASGGLRVRAGRRRRDRCDRAMGRHDRCR